MEIKSEHRDVCVFFVENGNYLTLTKHLRNEFHIHRVECPMRRRMGHLTLAGTATGGQ